ncbi:MAG TPA: hypothetical protein V6D20_05960 [Candidatus Obscuribacterales bacterium]
MDKQTAIKIIGQRLSGRTEADMSAFITGEMDLTQEGILEGQAFVPWFLSKVDVLEIGPTAETLELPAGFLMVDLEEGVFIPMDDGTRAEVVPTDWVSATEAYGSGAYPMEGLPKYYALYGDNQIQFFPKPDADYDVLFAYLKRDVPVSGLAPTGTNLWLTHAPDVFINEVGMACAEVVRDKDAYNLFQNRVQRAWKNLETKHMERRMAGQELYFF